MSDPTVEARYPALIAYIRRWREESIRGAEEKAAARNAGAERPEDGAIGLMWAAYVALCNELLAFAGEEP